MMSVKKGLFIPGENGGCSFGFWACQRPLTGKWGSGQVLERIRHWLGEPDIVFGKTDNISGTVVTVDANPLSDPTVLADWRSLPFADQEFQFGYWDPPYFTLDKDGKETQKPHMYKREGQEIWRTVHRLAILHTHVWPTAWLEGAKREAMVAVTMGPMKRIRILNVFSRQK